MSEGVINDRIAFYIVYRFRVLEIVLNSWHAHDKVMPY